MLTVLLLSFVLASGLYGRSLERSCLSCMDYSSTTEDSDGRLCKCDRNCHYYKDCCANIQHNYTNYTTPQLPREVAPTCHSAYVLQEAAKLAGADDNYFFMISSCPDKWEEPEGVEVRSQCMNETLTGFPPVTDVRTGLVYRNEHCAHCNEVEQIAAWDTSLSCSFDKEQQLPRLEDLLLQDQDLLQRQCTECSYLPPQMRPFPLIPEARPCIQTISTCAELHQSEDEKRLMEQCQEGPLDPVQGTGRSVQVFHNAACAECNREGFECLQAKMNSTQTSCPQRTDISINTIHPGSNIGNDTMLTVVITLRNLGQGRMSVTSDEGTSATVPVTCPEGQVPVGLSCRPTQCPKGYTSSGGRCSYSSPPIDNDNDLYRTPRTNNSLLLNCSYEIVLYNSSYTDLGNGEVMLHSDKSVVEVLDYDEQGRPIICWESPDPLNCSRDLIALNHSEYEVLENKSIIFQNTAIEVSHYDSHQRPLICPDQFSSANRSSTPVVLPELPGLTELSIIGCTLTVLGTFLLLLTYSLFRDLRTLPGLILMNLCTSILLNSLIYTIGNPINSNYTLPIFCSLIAIVLHYTYLTQFTWMSIFSLEITRTFYRARKMVQESRQTKTRMFIIYAIIAWVFPAIVVAVVIILNYTTSSLVQYGPAPDSDLPLCWVNNYNAYIATFLTPIALSLFINLVTFAMTTVLLCLAHRDQAKTKRSNKVTVAIIRVWLAAFITSGASWILGFVDQTPTSWVWYPFVILITTQGFAISLTFLLTKKVINSYLQLLGCRSLRDKARRLTKRLTGTLRVFAVTNERTSTGTST